MLHRTKKVAIIQSNYIPWKGYFDIINSVDEFVLLDTVQYTRRDWRNRNLIKTPRGLQWLTIPVEVKGKYHQRIEETRIADRGWAKNHWATIRLNYAKAPHFKTYRELFEELYLDCREQYLSAVNYRFIEAINKVLKITTKISWASQAQKKEDKTQTLLRVCTRAGGQEYLSGPSAQGYIDEEQIKKENIKLTWMDYSGYPKYQQLYEGFEHHVSIIDLLFCAGPEAPQYMKSF